MSGDKPLPAQFEPTTWYPELRLFPAATRAGDWPAIAAGFQQLGGWQAATVAIDLIADVHGADQFFRQVVARDPSPMAATILGRCLIHAGWRIRTAARASQVSRQQFDALHAHLRDAERALMDVTARDPRALLAWESRLTTARGLELGVAEGRRRYDRLARVAPHHFWAQSFFLQHACPKWGGSWEEAFGFARQCAAAAPPGGMHGALVATVHLERWASLTGDESTQHVLDARPEVWAAAQRSVLHPAFRREPGWVFAVNAFAFFFHVTGDNPAARPFFHLLGDFGHTRWWESFGDPVEEFQAGKAQTFGGVRA
ncbi:hypothetical protein [Cryptosporangium japonicum]|uniref:DUF4034 domain-containing protein n=1 Tax=Cryptosporangium japonicum TaxID=80872 RepID=A0ABN0URA7_9ACTN